MARNTSLGDILPEIHDVEIGEQSTPDWVLHALPVGGMCQMLLRKLSDVSMLQQHSHGRHSLHKGEQHEVAQFDEDTTELAYLVGQGANNTDWLSSKILVDLGKVEVSESTAGGNRPKGRDVTCRDSTNLS